MSKYRTTYNVITPQNMHIKSQAKLEVLKADDPCWCTKDVWITYEPAFEPTEHVTIKVVELHATHNSKTKPHWSK